MSGPERTPSSGVALRTPRLLLRPLDAEPWAWTLHLQGERALGRARLASSADDPRSATLEVALEPHARGLGLEGEALRGLVAHALLDLGLERVEADGREGDAAWSAGLAAAGFAPLDAPGRSAVDRAALAHDAGDWRRLGAPGRGGEPARLTCVELPIDVLACAPPALGAAMAVKVADGALDHALRDALGPVIRIGLGNAVTLSVFAVTAGVVVATRHTRLGRVLVGAPWPLGALLRDLREARGAWLLGLSCFWSVVVTVCVPVFALAYLLLAGWR